MSGKAVPLLILNLGGEMVYIIHQRLGAQGIPQDKSEKVIADIVGALVSPSFMDEVFKNQRVCSLQTVKAIFERIVNSSIMKLSTDSMDKMFDLMVMVFKYQLRNCRFPRELLWVTMNHLRGIRGVVFRPQVVGNVALVGKKFVEAYKSFSNWDLQILRFQLLNWVQNMHIKVSNFLKDGKQDSFGYFIVPSGTSVAFGCDVPGKMKLLCGTSAPEVRTFPVLFESSEDDTQGSLDWNGQPGTDLGKSIYAEDLTIVKSEPEASDPTITEFRKMSCTSGKPFMPANSDALHAKEELNLLSMLVDGTDKQSESETFKLNLFGTSIFESGVISDEVTEDAEKTAVIDSRIRPQNEELCQIFKEMELPSEKEDVDLLALMDEVV
ncbi:unnamed protein product [Notodromas monacha]|uniref:Protein OSCP1-like n=1 Tax=Notodromas monacha TaxID=399045 RepID=A0A7R9BJJ1_9CRUS|nr:unnamed protein product [Notodromas monacha]CAG0915827.1 unnamed protein product [Notodromas monacha]